MFRCHFCGKHVKQKAPGTHHRNHCPFCLHSLHLDNRIGDRLAKCGGDMAPIGKTYKADGEEMLVQTCQKCGITRKNRVAGDDSFAEIANLKVLAN